MKKYRFHLLLAAFVFLFGNTSPYWLHYTGSWSIYIELTYYISFLTFCILLFYNLWKCFSEKLKNKSCNLTTLAMAAVMIIAILFPGGLIPKRVIYKGDPLIAHMDGVAGNNGYLVLYGNNTYEYSYSLTVHIKGKYKVVNDTVFFDSPKNNGLYDFDSATLTKDKASLHLEKDSITYNYLSIIKNELIR